MLMPEKRTTTKSQGETPNAVSPEIELLAKLMDSVFHIPGIGVRLGFDAILGLIPGLGDSVTSIVSLYLLHAARKQGLPRVAMIRMVVNVLIDVILGSIPFVGDLFDVFWKANEKNVAIMRRHAAANPAIERKATWSDWLFLLGAALVLIAFVVGSAYIAISLVVWIARML